MSTMLPPAPRSAPRAKPSYDPVAHVARITATVPALPPLTVEPAPPSPKRLRSLLDRVTWWSDRRRLTLRELRQQLIDAAAATPDGVVARIRMLDRLNADLAIAEEAWHPNAGPDVAWPMGIWKLRYRGIEDLLRTRH